MAQGEIPIFSYGKKPPVTKIIPAPHETHCQFTGHYTPQCNLISFLTLFFLTWLLPCSFKHRLPLSKSRLHADIERSKAVIQIIGGTYKSMTPLSLISSLHISSRLKFLSAARRKFAHKNVRRFPFSVIKWKVFSLHWELHVSTIRWQVRR